MVNMKVTAIAFLLVSLLGVFGTAKSKIDKQTRAPLDEFFGYVDVRPGAHMFWVTYSVDQIGDWTTYPLIMWLQGGPGASGVGYGNFEELGPYYVNGSLREMAWTKRANVMFVDNPVGTGYSYVEDSSLYTTTNQEIADDLVTLLISVFNDYPDMSTMPFYVYAESYGGKMTVDFALALNQAINESRIVCNFQGVALGDSWISPMDSVNTWGPFLYQMGFVNQEGETRINEQAAVTQAAVDAGDWVTATDEWSRTETVVLVQTNGVNFYNVLAEEDIYRSASSKHKKDLTYMSPTVRQLYKRHVQEKMTRDALSDLMNGEMAIRWNIPPEVVWDSQGGNVFNTLSGDFMKPVINSVVQLLDNTDLFVAVFTGDLDLICDTPGTYRWIENMQWSGKALFDSTRRQNLYVSAYSSQAAYIQHYDNFAVYTILRSGHMVPIDAPEMGLVMVDSITELAEANKAKQSAKKVKGKVATKAGEVLPKTKETIPEHPAQETEQEQPKKETVIAAKHVKTENDSKLNKPIPKMPSAISAEAHNLATGARLSHLTPIGAKLGKREIISKKIPLKPSSPSGLNPPVPVINI